MTHPKAQRPLAVALLLGMSTLVAGCGFSTADELNVWLADQRKLHSASLNAMGAPQVFEAEAYLLTDRSDPFFRKGLVGEQPEPRGAASPARHASEYDFELAGERSELEKVSTDALQFKGTMSQDGVPVALVWANRQLHLVHLGDYLGPHHGKVLEITAKELRLRELLLDESGQWKPKATVLSVNEGSK